MAAVSAIMLACPATPAPQPAPCDAGCPATDAGIGGCGPGTFTTATGQCQSVGWTSCDGGFTADPTGWTCRAVVEGCDAGLVAFPGEGCSAIGWSTCPAGFSSTPTSCEPVLPAATCTGATRAALGQTTCVPVGDCSAPFPPATATHFVDADGGVDATHFRTIAAALRAAPAGATIAIAEGRYAESLKPTRAVKLVGRCPARISLVGNPAIELVRTRDVELESLTVRDSILAARLELGASLRLRHVVLEDNLRSGIQALDRGTQVSLDDVVIRGTGPDPATATFGQGIAMGSAAQLTLTDVELRGNGETALFLNQAGTAATLNRVVVSDTQPRASTGKLGWGIAVQAGASLNATQLVVQDSRGVGILIAQRGSSATLTDTVIRRVTDSTDNAGAAFGFGVSAQAGSLTWTGGAVEDVTGGLIDVQGADGVATVRNVSGQRTLTGPAPRFGVEARNGCKVTLERVSLANVASSGVLALDRSEVTIDHLRVSAVNGIGLRAQGGRITGGAVDVRGHTEAGVLASLTGDLQLSRSVMADAAPSAADAGLGVGASASQNSSLRLDECLLEKNITAAVYVRDPGSSATVTRSDLRATRLDTNGEFGVGVLVELGSKATIEDVAVAQNHTSGVQLAGASSELTMTRVTVLGTLPLASGSRGRGANVAFGAVLRSNTSAFVDNQQVGLFSFQSRIEATDTLVRGTRTDPDGRYGNGIEALTDGVISFVRGAIDRSASIGAVFAEGAGLLDGVRITNNTTALHAQDGTTIVELPVPPVSPGNRQLVVTGSTSFEGNQSKTSADVVTVPPP